MSLETERLRSGAVPLAIGADRPAEPGDFDKEFAPDLALACPVCGFNYTHVQSAHTAFGTDEWEGGTPYEGTQARGVRRNWRRDALAIGVWGECGHRFQIILQQHKGQTFIFMKRLPDRDDRE